MAKAVSYLKNLRLKGLMTMGRLTEQPGENRIYFRRLRELLAAINSYFLRENLAPLAILSMGMSGDFEDAIAEGATMVRVGSALFGPRPPMRSRLPS